eukprot:77370_1
MTTIMSTGVTDHKSMIMNYALNISEMFIFSRLRQLNSELRTPITANMAHGHGPHQIYGLSMLITGVVCGLIGLYCVYQFTSRTRSHNARFLKIRKPNLILLYCIFSLMMLLILSPIELVFQLTGIDDDLLWKWLFEFMHDLVISFMLVIIAARCWLLYYDHLYNLSTVDMTWRGAISANQQDFWLRHRKTWGDFGFITCVSIIIAVAVTIALSVVSIFALQHEFIQSLHIVTLILVVLPCCSSIFYITLSKKLKKLSLYDEFQIREEMQYLSLSTLLVLLSSIMCVAPTNELTHSIIQTAENLFCIITTYIQTQWLLTQLHKQTRVLLRRKHALRARKHKTPHLKMTDILKHKDGFEMFMRHCQRELNVEGLLFIVEVAQFKAQLHKYIHNIERVLKDRDDTLSPEPQHRPKKPTIVSDSDQRRDSLSCELSISTTAGTRTEENEQPHAPLPSLKQLDDRSQQTSTGQQIDSFKDVVLEQQWIPISQHMFKPHKQSNSDFARMSAQLQVAMLNGPQDLPESPKDVIRIEREKNLLMEFHAEDARMYEHALNLFMKYLDSESEFTINVSYGTQKDLLLFFSGDKASAFDEILNKNALIRVESREVIFSKTDQLVRSLVIKESLYLIFDSALTEVWRLLSSDTYIRFMQTKQYQYLLTHQKK